MTVMTECMLEIGRLGFPSRLLGITCGIMVIVAAIILCANSRHHELWGALVIAFSVTRLASWMGSLD